MEAVRITIKMTTTTVSWERLGDEDVFNAKEKADILDAIKFLEYLFGNGNHQRNY